MRAQEEKYNQAGRLMLNQYTYATVESLRGTYNPHGYFIGTWNKRTDLEEIFQTLLSYTDIKSNHHRVINNLWAKWKEECPREPKTY